MNTSTVALLDREHRQSKSVTSAGRPTDAEMGRTRSYLTDVEVRDMIKAARKAGRLGHRDATMILLAYRHGLRVSELVALQWHQVDLWQGLLHVARVKQGVNSTQPLQGDTIRALRKLKACAGYVFLTELGTPLSVATVRRVVRRAGELAGIEFPVHPHMLRHACGYALANRGVDTRTLQAYLGHKNIQHTVRYTELAPGRFNGIW